MSSLRPESAAALTAHRREAIRLAKSQEKAVFDRCNRSGQTAPNYIFDELIGKGSFGRVYKGRQIGSNKVVAIKVLDIDDADFQAFREQKDEQIRDFNREIHILRQAQDSGAENLNQMIEALPVHSQLWLICEYCPGGSVKTLMRATNDRLAEKYLIVVARELGNALAGLHKAGIMHRDVKAANVLIHENGGLQLCDFGVAATIEGSKDKRRTFIGTLHWMPPELWDDKPEYSDEVDVWGYGCTIYECALGRPPNADLRERQQLKMRMRRLKQSITLPEKEVFSDGLRSLVQFALNPDVVSRPSMQDITHHAYLAGTEISHPTSSLTELVQHYYGWLFSGGQRVSLFMPGGAAAASISEDRSEMPTAEEWNFSMTQDFEKRVSAIFEIPDLSDESWLDTFEEEATPKQQRNPGSMSQKDLSAVQQANFERRVQRGEGLANLFDQAKPAYEYKTKTDFVPVQPERRISDLPFRAMADERPSSIASNVIDLGDFDSDDYAMAAPLSSDSQIRTIYADPTARESTEFKLVDAATLRAKRADSKGPRDPNNLTAQRIPQYEPHLPSRQSSPTWRDEWTIGPNRPALQGAAEITPTLTKPRAEARQTMEWSFASAMSELTPTNLDHSTVKGMTEPTIEITEATVNDAPETKAKKHATLDWSFSDAMAEASTSDIRDDSQLQETPKRPAVLQRTMTQPITQHEVQEAYEDVIPSRPDTALSFAYSETSQMSTDFDPFSLERDNQMDDAVRSELDGLGVGSFYGTIGRTISAQSLNGPGPEDDGMLRDSDGVASSTSYHNDQWSRPVSRADTEDDEPQGATITMSNLRRGHFRGIGSHASRGSGTSNSSRGSNGPVRLPPLPIASGAMQGSSLYHTREPGSGVAIATVATTTSASSSPPSSSAGTFNTRLSHPNSVATTGTTLSLPEPTPPSLAALASDANPDIMERELERLLQDFQDSLGVVGDLLGEELRGRGRTRKGDREWANSVGSSQQGSFTGGGINVVRLGVGESEGEWEEDNNDDGEGHDS